MLVPALDATFAVTLFFFFFCLVFEFDKVS